MKTWITILGPIVAAVVGIVLSRSGWSTAICWTASITTLTAMWWVFEPIPIPATSLIPIALFPLVGVLPAESVAAAYGNKLILLLLGGFMLSSAMERSGAHRRIALNMVNLFGATSAKRLVFGFMAAAAVLSMWISNMATTLMMLPIVMAVVEQTQDRRLRTALLLGVAYAASVGGVGTPIGTPPNLIFMQAYGKATGQEPAFVEWMSWALPVVATMIPVVGLWLTRRLKLERAIELPDPGKWRREEVLTLTVFAVTALLWVTRQTWSARLALPGANDASVALAAVVVMFLIPNGRGGRLLDWQTAVKIPWGILLLFSSGMVIAEAFKESGLSAALGDQLAGLCHLPPSLLIPLICLAVTFLTEVTSNTATTNLLMPILAAAAIAAGIEPKLIMVPAAISASFAFMLPVATGPNAVVFGSDQLTVGEMAREGIALNLIGAAIIAVISYLLFV